MCECHFSHFSAEYLIPNTNIINDTMSNLRCQIFWHFTHLFSESRIISDFPDFADCSSVTSSYLFRGQFFVLLLCLRRR